MHIRPDQFASFYCCRLQRYAGATVLYFLSTTLNDPLAELPGGYGRANNCFVRCNTRAVGQRSNAGAIPSGKSH